MALEAGTAYVDLQPKLGAGFFSKIGGVLGGGGLKKAGLAAGAVLGAGIAVGVGAGLAAFKIGENFDEAFDTIRVGTGASGDALADLETQFKDTFTSVPASMGDAATAIADLNTRTGQTGDGLQILAMDMLDLSRITKSDLAQNIASTSRAFGDWGVEMGDQTGVLDEFFRASQASGAGVSDLAGQVVQFGAPLRNLGFSMSDSIALFAKWEQEGVNTEAVFAGLKIGIGKFAQEGRDVPAAFAETIAAIEGAGSASEATSIAIETFGQRAGPDLADAVRGGKFAIEDMLAIVEEGEETIGGAAADTESFGEKWKKFANKLMVAAEPLATRVFDAVGDAMDRVGPHIPAIIAGFERFFSMVGGWIRTAGDWWDDHKDTIIGFAKGVWDIIQQVMPIIAQAVGEAFRIIGEWIGKAVGWWNDHKVEIIAFGEKVWDAIVGFRDIVVSVFQTVQGWFQSGGADAEGFAGKWGEIWARIQEIFGAVATFIGVTWAAIQAFWHEFGDEILAYASTIWDAIMAIIEGAMQVIQGIIEVVTAIISGDWSAAWDGIKNIVAGVWDVIAALASVFMGQLKLVFTLLKGALTGIWSRMWNSVKSLFTGAVNTIKGWVSGWKDWLVGKFNAIKDTITKAWESLWNGLKGISKIGWDDFKRFLEGALTVLHDLWFRIWDQMKAKVKGVFTGLGGIAKSGLRAAAAGLVAGLNAAIGVINAAIRNINRINPFRDIPSIPRVSVPSFAEGGGIRGGGLALVGEEGPEVVRLGAGDRVFPMDRLGGGGRPYKIQVVLDGRVIASAVGPHLTDDITLHTGTRR